jgi:hypothetical protein
MNEKEALKQIKKTAKEHRAKNPLLNPVRSGKERDQKYLDVAGELGIEFGTSQFERMRKLFAPLKGFQIKKTGGDKWKTKALKEYEQQWKDWNTLATVALRFQDMKRRKQDYPSPTHAADLCGIEKGVFSRTQTRVKKRYPPYWDAFENNEQMCKDFIKTYESIKAQEEADREAAEQIGRLNAHNAFKMMLEKGLAEEEWFTKHRAEQEKLKRKLKTKE